MNFVRDYISELIEIGIVGLLILGFFVWNVFSFITFFDFCRFVYWRLLKLTLWIFQLYFHFRCFDRDRLKVGVYLVWILFFCTAETQPVMFIKVVDLGWNEGWIFIVITTIDWDRETGINQIRDIIVKLDKINIYQREGWYHFIIYYMRKLTLN